MEKHHKIHKKTTTWKKPKQDLNSGFKHQAEFPKQLLDLDY